MRFIANDEPLTDGDAACERLRLAALLTTLAALLIAGVAAFWLDVRWSLAGAASSALCLAVLLGCSMRLRSTGGLPAVATFSEVLGITLLGGVAGGAVAMIALRSGAPMADDWLSSADAAFGLSSQSLAAWLAGLGIWLDPLKLLYNSSFVQVAASILLLSFLGRTVEAWRLCFVFLAALLSCAVISFGMPAYGSFVDAAPATVAGLPAGSGTFAFDIVDRFRLAEVAVLGVNDLAGVITFPSFHIIMALITIQAWAWNPVMRVPVAVLNLAVIFTTLPIGGHYFVDLLAGIALWAIWSAVADAIVDGRRILQLSRPVVAA